MLVAQNLEQWRRADKCLWVSNNEEAEVDILKDIEKQRCSCSRECQVKECQKHLGSWKGG